MLLDATFQKNLGFKGELFFKHSEGYAVKSEGFSEAFF